MQSLWNHRVSGTVPGRSVKGVSGLAEALETVNGSRGAKAVGGPTDGSSVATQPAELSILVCTYRRPTGLRCLLESIARQQFNETPPRFEVLVADNDARRSGESVCERIRDQVDFAIRYEVEPQRGISHARNRTLSMIHPDTKFGVFVDDDEIVAPDWLSELLRVQREYEADVVVGPVLPQFLAPPPAWVVKGRFFEIDRSPTGRVMEHAYTGNALVRTEVFARMGQAFDGRYALSGGEDTLFFRKVHKAGFKIVWADEAIVHERVPPSRVNTAWVVQRAFRWGVAAPHIARDVRADPADAAGMMGRLILKIAEGPICLPISWMFGWHRTVTCLRRIAFAAGLLAGWYGMRYHEYRKTHGT